MTAARTRKVVVAMSGGVDSSVAAALLKQDGYEVVGCFMRLGSVDEGGGEPETCDPAEGGGHHQGCCSVNDAADARHVAALLDIPFYVLNFRGDFGRVIDYFVAEYNAGRTPNPCVRCNDWLKFGKLWAYARSIDADSVATGHYARIETVDGQRRLLRGRDHGKDQSYVLFGAPRDRLEHMLLPVGNLKKSEVRQIAQERKLPVFDKPDSQEICFVPDQDYGRLIERQTPEAVRPGPVVDRAGQVVGRHRGQQHFTIGQRRGVGVALGYPIYVTGKDPPNNTITVGPKQDLYALGLTAGQTNWLADPPEEGQWRPCQAKIRYNSPPAPARVRATAPDRLEVQFDEPQFAISPGQAVVCYDGEAVLGGGWIEATVHRDSRTLLSDL